MRSMLAVLAALALLLAACGGSRTSTETTASPTPTAETTTTTVPPPTTTTEPTETPTTLPAETSEPPPPSPTTAPLAPVTTGDNLPEALSRDLIPWAEVGAGWYLLTYDPTYDPRDIAYEDPPPAPLTVLYLVDGRDKGVLYEITTFDGLSWIADWRVDGSTALVWVGDHEEFTRGELPVDLLLVDVATGEVELLEGDHFDRSLYTGSPRFTTPKGIHLVARAEDRERAPGIQTLAYYDFSGDRLQELYRQTVPPELVRPGGFGQLNWLYGVEGVDLVVGHLNGVAYVNNKGGLIRDLWTPEDSMCQPLRWWAEGQFLAYCEKETETEALPRQCQRHLWLLRTDGTPGEPLLEIPEFGDGPRDSWPTASGVALQGVGADCEFWGVGLFEDGELEPLPEVMPGSQVLVDVFDERVAIRTRSCAPDLRGFYTYDLETGEATIIIPPIEDIHGVRNVFGLATVYP